MFCLYVSTVLMYLIQLLMYLSLKKADSGSRRQGLP